MLFRAIGSFLLAFCLSAAVFTSSASGDIITISGKVKDNPTISFSGIPNHPDLDAAMKSFLRSCGWFDLATSGAADYVLAGQFAAGSLNLNLTMGGAPVAAWRVPVGNQPRAAAKNAVDAILEKLFKIKGLCNTRIAFCADVAPGIKEIYVCDIDGGDVRQITKYNNLCVEPCWFPDGNSIGYTRYTKSSTDLIQTKLAPKVMSRRLSSFPGLNVGISVSPDGNMLALILSPDHMVDLYVKNVEGTVPRRLTKGKTVEASPCWSPDGRKICFVSDESGRPQLYTISPDGSGRTRLPSAGNEAVTPDWSDDNQIAYATRIGGSYTVAILDVKNGSNIRATNSIGNWESPSWGPDNRQLVCKRSDGKRTSLFIIDTWSGKVRQLLATANNLSMPSWSKAQK